MQRRTVLGAYEARQSDRRNERERAMKIAQDHELWRAWLGRGDEPVSQAAFGLDVARSV
jgi:hypothetical protein